MKTPPKATLWVPAALLLAMYGPTPARSRAESVNLPSFPPSQSTLRASAPLAAALPSRALWHPRRAVRE